MVGFGDSVAFGGDPRPGQAGFWAGQGCFGPGQAGFGPGQRGFGFGQVGFGGGWPGGGVSGERGSGYDRNAAGQGISAQCGAGSSGFVETIVDLGGWRPPMVRNWVGQTQFGVDSRVRKLKMPILEGEDAYG